MNALLNWFRRLAASPRTGLKRRPAPRWCPSLESLEDRLLPSISVPNGVLTVSEISGVNTIVLDTANGGVTVNDNGNLARFSAGQITSIQVFGGTGTDTINVESTLQGVPVTIHDGTGTETVNICPTSKFLDNIRGNVTVLGGGFDTLNVNDQNDLHNDTWTLTGPPAVMSPLPFITRTGAATISYSLMDAVTINGGSGNLIYDLNTDLNSTTLNTGSGSNEVNIEGALGTLNVACASNTTVNVWGGSGGINVFGTVNIYGASPSALISNTININDAGDVTARSVMLSTYSAEHLPWGQISGLALGTINYRYVNTSSLTLTTGQVVGLIGHIGHPSIDVQATSPYTSTKLVTHAVTQISVGNAGSVQSIQGKLVIESAVAGTNTITIDNSADSTSRTVTLDELYFNNYTGFGYPSSDWQGEPLDWGRIGGLAPPDINYKLSDTAAITIHGGNGNNTYNVYGTAKPVTINAGSGNEIFNVANFNNILGSLQGVLTLNGNGGVNTLNLFDQSSVWGQTYTLSNSMLMRSGAATISFANISSLNLTAGNSSDSLTVTETPMFTEVIDLGGGHNTLTGPNAINTWTINGANQGALDINLSFSRIENLIGGALNDTFKFAGSTASIKSVNGGSAGTDTLDYSAYGRAPVTVNLQTQTMSAGFSAGFSHIQAVAGTDPAMGGIRGNNLLIGANVNTTWSLIGPNTGTAGAVSFSDIQKLQGGSGVDVFQFQPGGSAVSITGGGAPSGQGDWLDYSAFPAAVTVNLATGSAANVNGGAARAIVGIRNVHGGNGGNTLTGSSQGNILICGSGSNTINGGTGRSLLIAGAGPSTLTGGSDAVVNGGDILIAGTTSFDRSTDAHLTALMAILAEWQSTDSYAMRFSKINTGTGMSAGAKLNWGTTVFDNGEVNTLTSHSSTAAIDWFFGNIASGHTGLHTQETGEHINNT